jgi:O-antigen ligase
MTVSASVDAVRPEAGRDSLGPLLRGATLAWIIGTTTVFPVGNERLEAISVFTFDRAAFLVVAALLALWVVRTPDLLRRWGWAEASMGLYLAVVLVSWGTTLEGKGRVDLKRDADLLLTSVAMPFTAFAVARYGGWSREQALAGLRLVVVIGATYLIAVGLVQALVDWRFLVEEVNQTVHRSRARGPFPNALQYAVLLAVLTPMAVVLAAREPRRRRRRLLFLLCAALAEALLLSQLRIAWVALPVALLYLAAVCPTVRRPALLVAAGFGALVGLASVGLDLHWIAGSDGALRQPLGSVRERLVDGEPAYNRIAVYATALNMISHRPLLGFGFGGRTFLRERGDYYASCCGVSPEWAVPCDVPHNEILNLLVLMGAVGLLAYLGMVAVLWRGLTAARLSGFDDPLSLAAAAQAGIVALVIIGQLHDVMYLSAAQTLLFFVVGLSLTAPSTAGVRS